MKYKHIIMLAVASLTLMFSCQDLDVSPRNVVTNEDILTNDQGVDAYMAAIYKHMPMEDFNVSIDGSSKQGYHWWGNFGGYGVMTGEIVNKSRVNTIPQTGYWSYGYQLIRQCNMFLANLPQYGASLDKYDEYIAEARFIRAYTYFALVKRYGGVPIIDGVQQMSDKTSELYVARESHEKCVDYILDDLDYAIEHLSTKKVNGRANKYVAAAFESRVALYAGSVARYGQKYDFISKVDGKTMLTGLPESRANEYFQKAYEASKIVDGGGYELYNGNADKAENFAEIFSKADDSKESIFIRQYSTDNYVHCFDVIFSPSRMASTYGGRYQVPLDWVELFDGINKDPKTGHIKTTNDDGEYIVYDNCRQIYQNWEPRLKGSILLPGQTYKGLELDIRGGIINESEDPDDPIDKFVPDDGNTTTAYTNVSFVRNNISRASGNSRTQKNPYKMKNGTLLYKNGIDGPWNQNDDATVTGFYGRKWLNLNLSVAETNLMKSTQSWIDIRYAEVLLNRAEAALELYQNGVKTLDNEDLQEVAYECINKIRERAGATLLKSKDELSDVSREGIGSGEGINSFVFAPNEGLHIIRVERYKELAFENKLFWDLRRWFTFDQQIYQYRRRALIPFMFAKGATLNANGNPEGKYIYDARVCERFGDRLTFPSKDYYDPIPSSDRANNPLLEQNDQY